VRASAIGFASVRTRKFDSDAKSALTGQRGMAALEVVDEAWQECELARLTFRPPRQRTRMIELLET
jgi:hypothetical protein